MLVGNRLNLEKADDRVRIDFGKEMVAETMPIMAMDKDRGVFDDAYSVYMSSDTHLRIALAHEEIATLRAMAKDAQKRLIQLIDGGGVRNAAWRDAWFIARDIGHVLGRLDKIEKDL